MPFGPEKCLCPFVATSGTKKMSFGRFVLSPPSAKQCTKKTAAAPRDRPMSHVPQRAVPQGTPQEITRYLQEEVRQGRVSRAQAEILLATTHRVYNNEQASPAALQVSSDETFPVPPARSLSSDRAAEKGRRGSLTPPPSQQNLTNVCGECGSLAAVVNKHTFFVSCQGCGKVTDIVFEGCVMRADEKRPGGGLRNHSRKSQYLLFLGPTPPPTRAQWQDTNRVFLELRIRHVYASWFARPTAVSDIMVDIGLKKQLSRGMAMCNWINRTGGKVLPRELVELVAERFGKLAQEFERAKERKKIINFEYVTRQILLQLGYPSYASLFHPPNTKRVVARSDQILARCVYFLDARGPPSRPRKTNAFLDLSTATGQESAQPHLPVYECTFPTLPDRGSIARGNGHHLFKKWAIYRSI